MDVHKKVKGVTAKAVVEAHRKDLEHQGKHEGQFLKYWVVLQTVRPSTGYKRKLAYAVGQAVNLLQLF